MSAPVFDLSLSALSRDPAAPVKGKFNGVGYSARVVLPKYAKIIERHYAAELGGCSLAQASAAVGCEFGFSNFGLIVQFAGPTEIRIADDEQVIDPAVSALIAKFGPLIIRNAFLSHKAREHVHRNIFPHLRFHYDRARAQPNQYSLFTRDPFDAVQAEPRRSSTLFVANLVAHLQYVRENPEVGADGGGLRASYEIFDGPELAGLFEQIVLRQPWNEPHGTGEICIIDNRTVLHASYHTDPAGKSWPIGAQYLF